MGTCQEGCLGYWQEEGKCEGWCENCGVCYNIGPCTINRHYDECDICHKNHDTADHYIVELAGRVQDMALKKSQLARKANVCEVCDGDHQTYECCDKCNYDQHLCHFCGDPLGHDGISACYILEEMGV